MTVRWVLIGDLDEPVGLLRYDPALKHWWNLELRDEWGDDDEWRPGWRPSGRYEWPGEQVLSYGKQEKPPSYLGSRPGVDADEVGVEEARRAVRFWGLSDRLIDEVPLTWSEQLDRDVARWMRSWFE